ncbi:MAG: hypothetical protein HY904_18455 [Deltaproteobacteria bacterium]|nr:hypothetical protein [Deltaproteobacteria bacterium]
MDKTLRQPFNKAWSQDLFLEYRRALEALAGPIPYALAETPLFLDAPLCEHLQKNALEILAQLSQPSLLSTLKKAIPAHYDHPGMDALPNCVQVDFALCPGKDGRLEGKLIEMQAFPSLYALMDQKCVAWNTVLRKVPGIGRDLTCFFNRDTAKARAKVGEMIVAGEDPQHVVLMDIHPEEQKTIPDFEATRRLYGVDAVCVTKIQREGKRLFREKDGKRIPIKRIYNRLVFDELEAKKEKAPWDWREELDVTWCSHPNWYWTWSKFVLPHLQHASVPRTTYVSKLREIPADLSGYVLKPLFSFAGTGVIIDVTRKDIDNIPADQRDGWVLQEKVTYAHALPMPDGTGVKAEVRVMLARPPKDTAFTPILPLVRLSRGKMIGVDHNKGLTWVGGTVGLF